MHTSGWALIALPTHTAPPDTALHHHVPSRCPHCAGRPAALDNAKVKLSFKLPYRCSFGQELCLVGSGDALGNWRVEHGRRMQWTDGDVWQVDFEVSAG
jgi:hypothetical protein